MLKHALHPSGKSALLSLNPHSHSHFHSVLLALFSSSFSFSFSLCCSSFSSFSFSLCSFSSFSFSFSLCCSLSMIFPPKKKAAKKLQPFKILFKFYLIILLYVFLAATSLIFSPKIPDFDCKNCLVSPKKTL